jgi:hypothetical protein
MGLNHYLADFGNQIAHLSMLRGRHRPQRIELLPIASCQRRPSAVGRGKEPALVEHGRSLNPVQGVIVDQPKRRLFNVNLIPVA